MYLDETDRRTERLIQADELAEYVARICAATCQYAEGGYRCALIADHRGQAHLLLRDDSLNPQSQDSETGATP